MFFSVPIFGRIMKSKMQIAWLLSYLSLASVSAAIITPALPDIELQFGLTPGYAEWLVSVFLIGYVIGQLLYGPLANRWGRVFALKTGLKINLMGILLSLAGIVSHQYWLLLFGRLVMALGAASGLCCGFMLINEWLPESQRKSAVACSILSFTLGIGLAVLVGGWISSCWTWAGCFIFLLVQGIIMLAGTAVFTETLKNPQAINLATIIDGYQQALTSSTLVIYALAVGFCSAIGYCFSAAAPFIANDLLHLSTMEYGYWNCLNIIGMLAGSLLAKYLLNRIPAPLLTGIGFITCIPALASLLIMWEYHATSSLWFFLSTAALYCFSCIIYSGASCIASNALSNKATGSSMMSFINMSTGTLAVIIMPVLANNRLLALIAVLSLFWLIITGLMLLQKFERNSNASESHRLATANGDTCSDRTPR
jgi:MFS family permease